MLGTGQNRSGKRSCRETAMDLLARREHSTAELFSKLASRGFAVDEIKSTVRKLQDESLQDDSRFAEVYVRSRVSKGFGQLKIFSELLQRGIDESIAQTALQAYDDAWLMLAQKQHQKRFGKVAKDVKEKSRQMRFLQQRGFDSQVIRQVVA